MSTFDVLEAYVNLKREVTLIYAAAAKDVALGRNQISILYILSQGRANMSELAEHTLSDKASITRTVALLERDGLIRRLHDEHDRRIVYIELSRKGKTQALKAQEVRDAIGKKLDGSISASDRKLFSTLVQKLVNTLHPKKEAI